MPFEPRNSLDILRSLAARVVARSSLTDVSDGSVMLHLLHSVAEEINHTEIRLKRIRESFFLEGVSGTPSDIAAKLSTGGNKVPPVVGQVGIRCVWCKGVRHRDRAKSSESFPSCVRNVHQAVRNYQR